MSDTLSDNAEILLFGRMVADLVVKPAAEGDEKIASLDPSAQRLLTVGTGFARIYGFGEGGLFHLLRRPDLYLVQGPGQPARDLVAKVTGKSTGADFPGDLMAWACARSDFAIRFEMQSGPLAGLLEPLPAHLDVQGMSAKGMSVVGMSIAGMSVHHRKK